MLLNRTFFKAIAIGATIAIPVGAPFAQAQETPAGPSAPRSAAQDSPLIAALRTAGVTDSAVANFYRLRDGAPLWTGRDPAWGAALTTPLQTAPRHGLPADMADVAALEQALATGGPAAEAQLMKAYLQLGRVMNAGLLNPSRVDEEIHIRPQPPAVSTLLVPLGAGQAPANFDALAPGTAEYARLMEELQKYADAVARDRQSVQVPTGPSLKPGQRSDRVLALRQRIEHIRELGLAGEEFSGAGSATSGSATGGDAAADADAMLASVAARAAAAAGTDPMLYDAALEEEVRRFQARNGLIVDGVAGPQTIKSLNAGPAERYNQILVNLERIRWLHRDPDERHIFVNQADFTMELMDRGEVLLDSRVVVGANQHQTPEFIEMMDHMVVNPTWHVPYSIATREILPKLKQDPGYLDRNDMRLVPTGSDPVPDGVFTDYSQYSRGNFPFAIKQNPGVGNSLGRVKFMFPNQFSIYLHDTPQKALFNRDARAFSHGCVRVQRPFDLAHALLEGQVDDPAASFTAWLDSERERRINLDRPVRVYLTYRTVWVDHDGNVQFRSDIYGRDAKVIAALRARDVGVMG